MTYLDNRGLFDALRRPRPPVRQGTTDGPYLCPIPVPFGYHYDSLQRRIYRYDFDGVGLSDPVDIDEFIASRAMTDTLHEVEEMMIRDGRLPGGPTAWPTRRWYHTDRWWLAKLRAYVNEWWGCGQPVRIVGNGDHDGRTGEIQTHEWAGEYVNVRIALYGGRVLHSDPARPVLMHLKEDCVWLNRQEAAAAREADVALVRARRIALGLIADPAKQTGLQTQAPPPPRDGILHPHRRLQL